MKLIQKYFILIYVTLLCVALYFLNSCSAEHHLSKAIKKDPTIFKDKIDTVKVNVPEYIESVRGKDSLIVDNNRIWIKTIHFNDSLFLDYKLKAVLVDTIVKTNVLDDDKLDKIINKKTRQDKRFEYKKDKLQIKKDAKVKIVTEKQKNKPKQNFGLFRRFYNYIKTYFFHILFLVIGFIIGRFTKFFSIKF
jgi:hypothetical protein